jgi:hypothetical protein
MISLSVPFPLNLVIIELLSHISCHAVILLIASIVRDVKWPTLAERIGGHLEFGQGAMGNESC